MTFAVASPRSNLNLSEKSNNQTNRLSYRTHTGRKEFDMIITENEHNIILNNMESLLEEYDYNYTTKALNTIINEWANQKQELIAAFKRHPNYLENEFCIAFNKDYEREITNYPSDKFTDWLCNAMRSIEIPQEVKDTRKNCELIPWNMYNIICNLSHYAQRTISEETAKIFSKAFPSVHIHVGEKTTRVVNKICTYLGFNKHPDYNREFAKYADSLNPLTIKRHTVLSLNPLDYLTMSFGNSWASCHTIDKRNKRGMPNSYHGQYSSGTISYMLDQTSMVLYTTDAANEAKDYWKQPKINRQMFHWGEEKLIQGRLYPQDNDSDGEAYKPYRNIVQQIISQIFDFPNFWTVKKGSNASSEYIVSEGTNYHDYNYYINCTLSRIKGSENENCIIVGQLPICIECGSTHDCSENINCCQSNEIICADCGCVIDEEDAEFIDGTYYCHDCCNYCECCNEYYRGNDTYVNNYGYVCEDCLDSEDFIQCEDCGEWFCTNDVTYLDNLGIYVCRDCLRDNFTECDWCGDFLRDEDINRVDGKDFCPDCLKKHNEENEEE